MKPDNPSKINLMETAIDLIWASSYGSVSVDDICAKATVNKGSFYHFFKSKSDLAAAAFERHWESKRPLLDSIFSPQVPALERLDRYCAVIVEDQKRRYHESGKMLGCPFCSIGSELGTQDENIRSKMEQILGRQLLYLESLVRDLASEGLIEASNSRELAEGMIAYITGVLMQAKIENSISHVERMRHGLHRLLGLRPATVAA